MLKSVTSFLLNHRGVCLFPPLLLYPWGHACIIITFGEARCFFAIDSWDEEMEDVGELEPAREFRGELACMCGGQQLNTCSSLTRLV